MDLCYFKDNNVAPPFNTLQNALILKSTLYRDVP